MDNVMILSLDVRHLLWNIICAWSLISRWFMSLDAVEGNWMNIWSWCILSMFASEIYCVCVCFVTKWFLTYSFSPAPAFTNHTWALLSYMCSITPTYPEGCLRAIRGCYVSLVYDIMTSSNGNFFCVTGHLCGEFSGEFPTQRPVTRSFNVFFDVRLNKLLSKQWRGWWFEAPSHPLWHHCNESLEKYTWHTESLIDRKRCVRF